MYRWICAYMNMSIWGKFWKDVLQASKGLPLRKGVKLGRVSLNLTFTFILFTSELFHSFATRTYIDHVCVFQQKSA